MWHMRQREERSGSSIWDKIVVEVVRGCGGGCRVSGRVIRVFEMWGSHYLVIFEDMTCGKAMYLSYVAIIVTLTG